MSEQKSMPRGRTFLAGKIISNYGQSSIDCIVRQMSDVGAVIEVESALGIPPHFHLLIPGEGEPQPCKRAWQSEKQVGLVFRDGGGGQGGSCPEQRRGGEERRTDRTGPVAGAAGGARCRRCRRAAAGCRHEIAIHQPRVPPHVGVAGRCRRSKSGIRRVDVSWPRYQGLRDRRQKYRRLCRRARPSGAGRRHHAARPAPHQWRGDPDAVREPAERRQDDQLYLRDRHRPPRRRTGSAAQRARQRFRGRRHAGRQSQCPVPEQEDANLLGRYRGAGRQPSVL